MLVYVGTIGLDSSGMRTDEVDDGSAIAAYHFDYETLPNLEPVAVYESLTTYSFTWYGNYGNGPFHNLGPAPGYIPYPDEIPISYRGWALGLGPCGVTDIEDGGWNPIPEDAWITSAWTDPGTNPWSLSQFTTGIKAHFDGAGYTFPATSDSDLVLTLYGGRNLSLTGLVCLRVIFRKSVTVGVFLPNTSAATAKSPGTSSPNRRTAIRR